MQAEEDGEDRRQKKEKEGERCRGQTPKRQRADINLHDSSENNNGCLEILFKDCNINLMGKISNKIPRELFNRINTMGFNGYLKQRVRLTETLHELCLYVL